MPPSPPAEDAGSGRDRLFALRTSLNDLQIALQGGHWEALEQLAPKLGHVLQELKEADGATGQADAAELRRLLAQIEELQLQASARQQQIGPLLNAWRKRPAADDTPSP